MRLGHGIGADEAQRVVEAHYADVLAYCRRHTATPEDAADAAQETFLRFVRAHPGYRDRGKPLAFLLTIARNTCIDQARVHTRDTWELPEEVADAKPLPDDEASELAWALQALLPQDRELLELRFGQGLTVGEVARVLGVSRFAAGRKIKCALEQLHAALGDG